MPFVRHLALSFVCAACAALAVACGGSSSTSPTSTTTTAALQSVSLSPTSVAGGLAVTGTVTLTANAPVGGALVTLTSSSAAATVPANVTVDAGTTGKTFEIDTVASAAASAATITAAYLGVSQTATLTIGRLTLQSLSLSAASVVGGAVVTGTVTVATAASAGGLLISLSSSSPAVVVPASVTIDAGATSQSFDITTQDVPMLTTATITATVVSSGSTRTANLTVGRLALDSVWVGVPWWPGGVPLTGLVTLTVAAPPAGVSVALRSSSPAAVVPAAVTVPAGSTSQPFDIVTANVPPTTTATITATYAGVSQSATLTVVALPAIASFSCTPTTAVGGTTIHCAGTLANPAPPAGWPLALSSSDPSANVPASLSVAAAGLTFQFDVTTVAVTTTTAVTIRIADATSGSIVFSQALSITAS
jgi:hypothetical protein